MNDNDETGTFVTLHGGPLDGKSVPLPGGMPCSAIAWPLDPEKPEGTKVWYTWREATKTYVFDRVVRGETP